MKHRLAISGILLSVIFIANACKQTSEPENNTKNPLEMTWKCDTLMYTGALQTIMYSIYVRSASNVLAVGHCNLGAEGMLWNYNGSSWAPYSLFNDISRSPLQLFKVYGFNTNDVWIVGDRFDYYNGTITGYKPLILRYLYGKWNEITPGVNNITKRLLSICGNSSNDYWVCGDDGVILHYNYGQWSADTIKIKLPQTTSYILNDIKIYKGKLFVLANLNDPKLNYIKSYYFNGNEKNWQLVDSSIIDRTRYYKNGGDLGFFISKSERLFSYGSNGVWEWINGKWSKLLWLANNTIGGMAESANDCFYAVGDASYYFDGSSWTEMNFLKSKSTEWLLYTDVWTDGKETFITGHNTGGYPNRTYIWHGK
jgi:hypothetical protein